MYDLAGTVDEWTRELMDGAYLWPATSRCYFVPCACYTYTGLRAACCLGQLSYRFLVASTTLLVGATSLFPHKSLYYNCISEPITF